MKYKITQKYKWIGVVGYENNEIVKSSFFSPADIIGDNNDKVFDGLELLSKAIKLHRKVDSRRMIVVVTRSRVAMTGYSPDAYRLTPSWIDNNGVALMKKDIPDPASIQEEDNHINSDIVYIMPYINIMDRHLKNSFKESLYRVTMSGKMSALRIFDLDRREAELAPCVTCNNIVACISNEIRGVDGDFPVKDCAGYSEITLGSQNNRKWSPDHYARDVLENDKTIEQELFMHEFIKGEF